MARAQHPAPNLQATTRRLARFEKRIDLIRQSLDVPGMSVAVLHQQDIIFARGLGMVDVAARTQAAVNTPYPIASLTKTFATAVIMRLVERGKLNLDEPMTTYDPDYGKWCKTLRTGNNSWSNFHCDTEKITVRQFLNHTEQGTPGTNFEYSAFLFARLTAVVDAVSGKGFLRSIEDEVLDPLQMRDTALGSKDPRKTSVVSRMAKPYALNQSEDVVEFGRQLAIVRPLQRVVGHHLDGDGSCEIRHRHRPRPGLQPADQEPNLDAERITDGSGLSVRAWLVC